MGIRKKGKRTPISDRPPRVVWTDAEKAKIISKAVDFQSEHPDLAGLPLIRAAITELPKGRRRKLLAVTQAPWFEPGVADEIRRRRDKTRADLDFVPLAIQNIENTAAINREQLRFIAFHEQWKAEHIEHLAENNRLLACVLRELQILNSKMGSPVPVRHQWDRNEADERGTGGGRSAKN